MHVNLRRVSVQSSELIALVLVPHNRASRKDDVRETVRDVECAIRRYKTAGKGFVNTTQRGKGAEEERKERARELVRIFPRMLTTLWPSREQRTMLSSVLLGGAALTRRPNTGWCPSIVSANNETMDSGQAILMVGLYAP